MLVLLLLGRNQLHSPTRFFTPLLHHTSIMMAPRFIPSGFDAIEGFEDYQPGGYHPISVGDTFNYGCYRVLHKLGFGGFSTVWLACDQRNEGDQTRIIAPRCSLIQDPERDSRTGYLSFLLSLSTSIAISSYKVQTAPTYSSFDE